MYDTLENEYPWGVMSDRLTELQQEIHLKAEADHAHKNAHRREAILLSRVWNQKRKNEQLERTREKEPWFNLEGGRNPIWNIG